MDVKLYNNIGSLNLDQCSIATLQWSQARGITVNGKAETQFLKLVEEIGELANSLSKGKCIRDDVGDCLVLLTNLTALKNLTLEECWNTALDDIKDREGFLNSKGNFIKSTDPDYDKLYAQEFSDHKDQGAFTL